MATIQPINTVQVNVHGDIIEAHYDGNVWVAPTCGAQYSTRGQAIRQELLDYFRSCGEDVDDPEVAEEIEGYVREAIAD